MLQENDLTRVLNTRLERTRHNLGRESIQELVAQWSGRAGVTGISGALGNLSQNAPLERRGIPAHLWHTDCLSVYMKQNKWAVPTASMVQKVLYKSVQEAFMVQFAKVPESCPDRILKATITNQRNNRILTRVHLFQFPIGKKQTPGLPYLDRGSGTLANLNQNAPIIGLGSCANPADRWATCFLHDKKTSGQSQRRPW